MNKKRLRIVNDVTMWFLFCFMFGTGALMHYRLVPGSKGGQGLSLLGMSRHEWGEYHLGAGYLFLALLCVHLALNFSFIKNAIAKRTHWRYILILSGGLMIVAFFLFAPVSKETHDRKRGRKNANETQAESRINRSPQSFEKSPFLCLGIGSVFPLKGLW